MFLSPFLGSTIVSDRGLIGLSNLPNLKELKFYEIDNITAKVFYHFKKLKKLKFTNCENVNIESLCDLISACEVIEDLAIFSRPSVDANQIISIIRSASALIKARSTDVTLTIFFGGITETQSDFITYVKSIGSHDGVSEKKLIFQIGEDEGDGSKIRVYEEAEVYEMELYRMMHYLSLELSQFEGYGF